MNLSPIAVCFFCEIIFWSTIEILLNRPTKEAPKLQYLYCTYTRILYPTRLQIQKVEKMKSVVGILLTVLCASTPLAVASQQYYDDYGEDAGDYYQQQDYGAPAGGDYYGDEGADTLYQDYAQRQEEKAMGKGGL